MTTLAHAGDYTDASNATSYGGGAMTPFEVLEEQIAIIAISYYSGLAALSLPSSVAASGTGTLTLHRLSAHVATAANEPSLLLYAGLPTGDFSGTLTVTFADGQRGLAMSVEVITDPSPAEPVRLANRPTPTSGTGTSATSTLAALAAATSIHYYAVAHQADEATTVASGFTELADLHFADAGSSTAFALETGYKVNDTTADPSWATSSAYVIASLELQPEVLTAPTAQAVYQPTFLLEIATP